MTIYKYAGFWRRLGAYTVDNTIIIFIFIILAAIAAAAFFFGAISGNSKDFIADLINPERYSPIIIFTWLFFIFLNIAYFTYFHGATGRTPGKMLFGLQVVSTEGAPISFGIAFLRAVGYFVSGIFNIGFIWVAFDKRKQGWHDKIAGTVVIIREPQNETAGISISDNTPVLPTSRYEEKQDEASNESTAQPLKPSENNNN
ncbi:MAG: RDD family protein [Deltaproteobacteria bacterium]|nr:RDD family protein [Deltaproteobacteria bacterium]